jgi:cytoskeletal protein CcmA (bactofilin family)
VVPERRDGKGGPGKPRGGETGLTIIAVGTRVTGDVDSDGVVKVEGEVVGGVRAERQVLVARGGRVEGDVVTPDAVLGGVVQGSVAAEERVEVQPGAVVNGDIVTGRLIVQEGGEVNGSVHMTNGRPGAGPAPQSPAPPPGTP